MSKCRTGKRGWRDEAQAKNQLTRILQSGDQRKVMPKRIYQCEFCHHWHFTSRDETPGHFRERKEAPQRPDLTPLEQAEADRDALEGIVRRCIADGCGMCMHDPAWGAFRIRHEFGNRASVTDTNQEEVMANADDHET